MSDAMMRMTEMARMLADCKADIAATSEQLALLKQHEAKLEMEDMPELMRELEIKSFTLKDGTKISLVDDLLCGITEANRNEAHTWLRENKFGGIIKTVVSQRYDAGDIELAIQNAAAITALTGREAAVTENIHASTLKAFLKEQRAKGTKIPAILFGLFPFSKAKVAPPKG